MLKAYTYLCSVFILMYTDIYTRTYIYMHTEADIYICLLKFLVLPTHNDYNNQSFS